MKIRCVTDSIRFRVRKSDLMALKTKGVQRESLTFPNGREFGFSLGIADIPEIQARQLASEIQVLLPIQQAKPWIESQQVGLEAYIPLPTGKQLHILIEKDFPCKDSEEDFEDTFFELAPESEGLVC